MSRELIRYQLLLIASTKRKLERLSTLEINLFSNQWLSILIGDIKWQQASTRTAAHKSRWHYFSSKSKLWKRQRVPYTKTPANKTSPRHDFKWKHFSPSAASTWKSLKAQKRFIRLDSLSVLFNYCTKGNEPEELQQTLTDICFSCLGFVRLQLTRGEATCVGGQRQKNWIYGTGKRSKRFFYFT